ncbi:MAG TPA: plastocyanin/azurin family copper-binding protein [Thermoleophilaceae bacterium]|nr:plastocyanin/azurin family copper-binding protein [Thermoleophilaceae bacterium]
MRVATALLCACSLLLAGGCSDEEEEPRRSVTVRTGATVEMGADEYRFDPGRVVVRAGGREARLGIVLVNRGSLAHNIHVRDGERDLAATRSFPEGQRRSVTARLRPGSYRYVCTVADHEELGMVGRLEVK